MLIVAGWMEVPPDRREAYVESRRARVVASREEAGCLAYVVSADPLDPGRVWLFERWESRAHLDEHLAGTRFATGGATTNTEVLRREVNIYEVADQEPLG